VLVKINVNPMKSILLSLILISLFTGPMNGYGQISRQPGRIRNNIVHVNLTNPLIFGGRSWIIGYERNLNDKRTFSVNVGQFSLPKFVSINTDSITSLSKDSRSYGLSMSADYRFYLAMENRYRAPRGVYIGPYFSYNNFNRKADFHACTAAFTGDLSTEFTFRAATVGFQLGYQFVIRDRFTLDLILFGPGISSYKIKAGLSTSLSAEQEAELFGKINDFLKEKIPGYSMVIGSGSFETSGVNNTTSFGYRYVVTAGFRF
jgi:hypothetical protein